MGKRDAKRDTICRYLWYYSYNPTYESAKETSIKIRENYPKSRIVVGGAHAQFLPIDFADTLIRGKCLSSIGKLFLEDGVHIIWDGEMNRGYPLPLSKIDFEKYVNKRRVPHATRTFSLICSIGCNHRCGFCYNKYLGAPQSISVKCLEKTVERLIASYGIDGINFLDDNFLLFEDLYSCLKKYNIKWRSAGTVQQLLQMDLSDLSRSGCSMIFIGIESGSDVMLERMNKPQDLSKLITVVQQLHDVGIECRATIMVGFPGETWKTVDETARILSIFDSVSINLFTPYPGSDVFRNPEVYGIKWISSEWSNYRSHLHTDTNELTPVFETETLNVETLTDMFYYLESIRETVSE